MSFAFERCLLRSIDRIAKLCGVLERPLRGEDLVRLAQDQTGLTDFGDSSFEEPLDILLSDYHRTANLSLFGRLAARWDSLRFLTNLLQLREAERRHPEILRQPIDKPIFITGFPRSGSSFLHNLLAQDDGVLIPLIWETISPCPKIRNSTDQAYPEAKKAGQLIARFNRLAPEMGVMHPMTAFSAQECSEITAHIFRSPRFLNTHLLSGYAQWLAAADELPAYRFHKRFLQHLQYRKGPGRWILKCPEHVFSLDAIRAVYPDARFIFMHREPFEMLQSVTRLIEVMREPFTRQNDPSQIGRWMRESWARGADLLVDADRRLRREGVPIMNVRFRQLVGDPLATVKEIYRRFDLPLREESIHHFARHIAADRNGAKKRSPYRPAAFGLAQAAVANRFHDYAAHFSVDGASRIAAALPVRLLPDARPFGGGLPSMT
jgi:hypothetical protein